MSVEKKEIEFEKKGDYFYYDSFYPYPDVSINFANDIIMMWIKKYLAVLFLRQYTLIEWFTNPYPMEKPIPPQDSYEKKRWIREFANLRRYVNDYLKNKELLNSLGMGELCEEDWFINNNKQSPNDLIDEYVKEIKAGKNTNS